MGQALWEFAGAVLSSWAEKVGIVLTLFLIIERIPRIKAWLRDKPLIDKFIPLLWIVASSCVLWGFYAAWASEKNRADSLQATLTQTTKPDFVMNVWGVIATHVEPDDVTLIFIYMQLTNRGADSSITSYQVQVHTPSYDGSCPLGEVGDNFIIPTGGVEYHIHQKDMLPLKTLESVQRGHTVGGVVICSLPGNHQPDLEVPGVNATATLTIKDYLGGQITSGPFSIGGRSYNGRIPIFPGQEVTPKRPDQ